MVEAQLGCPLDKALQCSAWGKVRGWSRGPPGVRRSWACDAARWELERLLLAFEILPPCSPPVCSPARSARCRAHSVRTRPPTRPACWPCWAASLLRWASQRNGPWRMRPPPPRGMRNQARGTARVRAVLMGRQQGWQGHWQKRRTQLMAAEAAMAATRRTQQAAGSGSSSCRWRAACGSSCRRRRRRGACGWKSRERAPCAGAAGAGHASDGSSSSSRAWRAGRGGSRAWAASHGTSPGWMRSGR